MASANTTHLLRRGLLDSAYTWICKARKDAHPNHDVWRLRERWDKLRGGILERLRRGTYRLAPVRMIDNREGQRFESWEGEDAIVLKSLQLALKPLLTEKLSQHCYHLEGRGGHQGAVKAIAKALATDKYRFVMRTDVRGYYASIHHPRLLKHLRTYVNDPRVLELVSQYCHRTTVHRGHYQFTERGIPLGCSLSPLMGALYLDLLNKRLEQLPGIVFARFQDDVVILVETRWKLHRAIKVLNQAFAEPGVEKHPDKTSIGRVERGFDFLGTQFALHLDEAPEAVSKVSANKTTKPNKKHLSLKPSRSAVRRMAEQKSSPGFMSSGPPIGIVWVVSLLDAKAIGSHRLP